MHEPAAVVMADSPKPFSAGLDRRRADVLAMLNADSSLHRAAIANERLDPETVIVTVAIRNVATLEMLVPKGKWDAGLFLECVKRCGVQ